MRDRGMRRKNSVGCNYRGVNGTGLREAGGYQRRGMVAVSRSSEAYVRFRANVAGARIDDVLLRHRTALGNIAPLPRLKPAHAASPAPIDVRNHRTYPTRQHISGNVHPYRRSGYPARVFSGTECIDVERVEQDLRVDYLWYKVRVQGDVVKILRE